jgi:hypothetical protein
LNDLREIREGKKDTHEMDYRVSTRSGETVWIHCRGSCYRDETDFRCGWWAGSPTRCPPDDGSLTGAFNLDALRRDIDVLLSDGADGYLLLAGVDDLKSINLKNGRACGDQLLKRVVQSMEETTDGERRSTGPTETALPCCFRAWSRHRWRPSLTRPQEAQRAVYPSGGVVPFRTYWCRMP